MDNKYTINDNVVLIDKKQIVYECSSHSRAILICRLLNKAEDIKTIAGYADCTFFTFHSHGFESCSLATNEQLVNINGSEEWCEVCSLKKKIKMYPFSETIESLPVEKGCGDEY